ncbi:BTAD domain-containing putative transcriptional regulator [Anaeromyxobacter oryzisoli]|uniref:BTAD domain-containing putative transcriptional regulator n=1 Tax=Anaeromyxobacter oryzisoli TaxID=2925408 RepID=UPI001F57951C|nr:BTAD domain-containing putative transcriptional regulator [Anaeromyxobacter sp. SG63]
MAASSQRGGALASRREPLLRLYLLGRFEVVREDVPIPPQAWRRRRPADLLKLVALAPGRTLTREKAIEALWPDKDPASGANNLHRALYDLRQILGGRWVDIERGRLRLREDVWLDVDAFEHAVQAGGRERWAEAVALYHGELSPEDRESPWLASRRALLRARFAEAIEPLARAAADEGNGSEAIPLLRRLLEVEPAAEDAHQLLMKLLAGSGRRAEALRQYDACESALHAAGLAPSEQTRGLRQAIQRGELGPAPAALGADGAWRAARRLLGAAEPAPVRGRSAILLLLESLAERGYGALVLLGERGVGKTRLAVEGARIAQARGARVFTGIACAPAAAGASAPYALFADLFREEARVHPGAPDPFAEIAAGGSAEAIRLRVLDAVVAALVALAEGHPLCLVLQDLHDADESSLNLLHFLARRAPELRLSIIGTCREDAIHAGTPIQMALAHLDGGRLARGVRVPRLGLAGTRELVEDLLGGPAPEGVVSSVYHATDGLPALVEEAVRSQAVPGQQIPADPAAALRARVARLGARAEALLAAAAVAGRRFDFELVRPATGLNAHEAVTALEACLEARLLDEDGAGYHFHDTVVRDVIYDGLAPERRAALHAAVADAIEAAAGHAAPAEALAYHRRLAGQRERAVRHLVAAGHRAADRAGLSEALTFFAEALALLDPDDVSARLELLDAAGRVQLQLGELGDAARSFGDAARLEARAGAGPAPEQRARAHRLAAVALAAGGDLTGAQEAIDDGLVAATAQAPEEVAPLLHLRAQLLWHAGRHEAALATARACVETAAAAGDADLVARGQDLAAIAGGMLGLTELPPDEPLPARARLHQDTAPEHLLDVHATLWERDLLGDASAAEVARAAALIVERARQRNAPEAVSSGRLGEATCALAGGQLEAAELALRAALEGFRGGRSAFGEALAMERLGTLLTIRGRIDEARELLGDGVVIAERAALRRHVLVRLHAAEARNRLAAGLFTAAEDAVKEASESAARHGECASCDAMLRAEAVRVAIARGRIADADVEARQLEELASARGGRVLGAIARLARARVLVAQQRSEDALVALAEARAAFLAAGHRYEAARCVRLEKSLRGPAGLAPALLELDALVVVDGDA